MCGFPTKRDSSDRGDLRVEFSRTIEKAASGYAYEMQMANMVIDCVRYSESQFNALRAKWPRLYDLWRGSWSGRFHPH